MGRACIEFNNIGISIYNRLTSLCSLGVHVWMLIQLLILCCERVDVRFIYIISHTISGLLIYDLNTKSKLVVR